MKLYKDQHDIFRSKTRLGEANNLPELVKFPNVLPSDSHISKIIILDAHESVLYSRVDSTLNRVRRCFWIIRGKQTYIYVLLFTCATPRFVHLERTPDMSTPTLILALRQFLAGKGFPVTFNSDNFKSFKSVILKKFLRNNKIDGKFILDRSPWCGSFYKRLVKVVKDSLNKVVKNARLNYDELITALIETEAMINSRPLNYLSEEDNTEGITPFHLPHGRNIAVA